MPKVKALYTIGVNRLLGSHAIPNVAGIIPNGAVLELSEEIINLIGADSFEVVANEETKMSEELKTEVTPEVTPVVETEVVTPVVDVNTPAVEVAPVTPEVTPAA